MRSGVQRSAVPPWTNGLLVRSICERRGSTVRTNLSAVCCAWRPRGCRLRRYANDHLSAIPFKEQAERAMKYLCLVYFDEKTFAATPEKPEDAECFAFGEGIRKSGRYVAAE